MLGGKWKLIFGLCHLFSMQSAEEELSKEIIQALTLEVHVFFLLWMLPFFVVTASLPFSLQKAWPHRVSCISFLHFPETAAFPCRCDQDKRKPAQHNCNVKMRKWCGRAPRCKIEQNVCVNQGRKMTRQLHRSSAQLEILLAIGILQDFSRALPPQVATLLCSSVRLSVHLCEPPTPPPQKNHDFWTVQRLFGGKKCCQNCFP